jgi:hypothetical protein
MSSKSRTEVRRKVAGTCFVLVTLGAALGGCSDIYYDRRETVALGADDHIASNTVEQMVDPWPRYVGNKNIAFNGERLQGAVERYRRHEVIQPRPTATTSTSQPLAPSTTEVISLPTTPTTTTPAAPVK